MTISKTFYHNGIKVEIIPYDWRPMMDQLGDPIWLHCIDGLGLCWEYFHSVQDASNGAIEMIDNHGWSS